MINFKPVINTTNPSINNPSFENKQTFFRNQNLNDCICFTSKIEHTEIVLKTTRLINHFKDFLRNKDINLMFKQSPIHLSIDNHSNYKSIEAFNSYLRTTDGKGVFVWQKGCIETGITKNLATLHLINKIIGQDLRMEGKRIKYTNPDFKDEFNIINASVKNVFKEKWFELSKQEKSSPNAETNLSTSLNDLLGG